MKFVPNPNDQRPSRAFEAATIRFHNAIKGRGKLPAFIEWYFTETRYGAMNWIRHVRRALETDLARLPNIIDHMTFSQVKTRKANTQNAQIELKMLGLEAGRSRIDQPFNFQETGT